ncbi:MAG: phospholipid carrier-dependent glycosyltransferase [Chthoniobacterales bacterium]
MPSTSSAPRKMDIVALAIVFALGIWLRIPPETFAPGGPLHPVHILHPQPAFKQVGFDEGLYREYVNALIRHGITAYPDIFDRYIDVQKKLPGSILPPARFLYIFTAYLWHALFGGEALLALHQVAAFFSVLTLAVATACAWRMRGSHWALGIAALMAVSPTQLHMSQHALVDGFFAFWALLVLWLLWENLRAPRNWRWLVAYVLALGLLVLTKENSFFVWVAILALLVTNRWLQFGTVTRELLVATILGPLLGAVVLIFLAGGIEFLFQSYQLSVGKNFQLRYAILTGDGPWYRYIVDLVLVSPVILLLAIGALFRLDRTKKPELFLSIFITASYLVMCNVRYGMNLRYANMWDMPLRFLALSVLVSLVAPLRRYRNLVLVLGVGAICAIELRQYFILAVQFPLYELVSEGLLRALRILKGP